jgi:hypothetical protein
MAVGFAQLRDAALQLPGVTEGVSYGAPCLKVGKVMLARLRDDGETLVLKVDHVERDILLDSEPATFFITDHYRGYPLVLVRLEEADQAHIEALLRRAWFASAPKRLSRKVAATRRA